MVLGFTLVVLLDGGCGEQSAAHSDETVGRKFAKGVVGVWVVQMEPTLQGITDVPHEVRHQFADVTAYKAWLREKLEGLQFEFYPDNKVFLRFPKGKSPFVSGESVWPFNWERREGGSYWLSEPGSNLPFMSIMGASIGHRFDVTAHDSAVCRYQVEWNENSAPRAPLVLQKTWE